MSRIAITARHRQPRTPDPTDRGARHPAEGSRRRVLRIFKRDLRQGSSTPRAANRT